MASAANQPANRPRTAEVGQHPSLGYELPANIAPIHWSSPPQAFERAYRVRFEARYEEAWDLYRKGVIGIVHFPWVRTHTGEIGRWQLAIGSPRDLPLEEATVVRRLQEENPYLLPPGWLAWTPAREVEESVVFYHLGESVPAWDLADLHPEWDISPTQHRGPTRVVPPSRKVNCW